MANDANIFKRGSASDAYVVPEIWMSQIEALARENNIMLGLSGSILVEDRSGAGAGDKINMPKQGAILSAAAVTDGNSIGISAVSFSEVEVTATIKGAAVQMTLKQLRDQLSAVEPFVVSDLGKALGDKEESDIFTELYTTSQTVVYPGTKTNLTITSTDVLDVATINKAMVAMRTGNRKPMYLVIHPKQEGDLRVLQQFTDASYYGSNDVVANGEIGRFYGLRVFSSTKVGTATENSTTVYKSLLLGPRAAVFYIRNKPVFEMNRNLIQDLSVVMQVWEDYGVKILNDESIRIVKSA